MNATDMQRAKFYQDLYELPEDDRIRLIGHWVEDHGENVTVLTDDIPGKRERYIEKLTSWFPGVEVVELGTGPVDKCVSFRVTRKKSEGTA